MFNSREPACIIPYTLFFPPKGVGAELMSIIYFVAKDDSPIPIANLKPYIHPMEVKAPAVPMKVAGSPLSPRKSKECQR